MLPSMALRQDAPFKFPYDIHSNPYKAKRLWPPDFDHLPPKYQFRLERKYRRRAKLKWARPTWMAYTKIAQWTIPIGIIGYVVLYMDWGSEIGHQSAAGQGTPPSLIGSLRQSYQALADSLFSHTTHYPSDATRTIEKDASGVAETAPK